MASTIGATPKVYKNVRSYFERELKNYEVILVRQKITEDYLYRVMAQHKITGEYAVWTCWNETTQSLNFGHYDLTKETAIDILFCKGEWDF